LAITNFIHLQDLPTSLNYLPKNTNRVLAINMQEISQKLVEESVINNKEFDQVIKKGYEKDVIKLIESSWHSGIGIIKWIVAFSYKEEKTGKTFYGAFFDYQNEEKFLKFSSEMLSPFIGSSAFEGRYTHIDNIVLALNGKTALLLYTPTKVNNHLAFNVSQKLLKEKEGSTNLLNQKDDLRALFNGSVDLAFWFKFSESKTLNSQALDMVFKDGIITSNWTTVLKKEGMQRKQQERLMTIDDGFMKLDYEIPITDFLNKSMLDSFCVIDIDSLGNQIILTNLIDGPGTINFHAIGNYKSPETKKTTKLPEFDAAFQVSNPDKVTKMLNLLADHGKIIQSETFFTFTNENGYRLFLKQKKNQFLVSSKKWRLNSNKYFMSRKPGSFLQYSLNFKKLQVALPSMIERLGMKSLNIFNEINFEVDKSINNQLEGKAELTFLNQEIHSLSQLFGWLTKTRKAFDNFSDLIKL